MPRRTLLPAVALAVALPLVGAVPGATASDLTSPLAPGATTAGSAEQGAATAQRAAGRYRAAITRTKHGIPHIVADDFGSLGFGSGYATAGTHICNLADTLVTARGQRSRWFGPEKRYDDQVTLEASNLQVDALVTDLRNRKVVEGLLADPVAGPGPEAKQLVAGYTAGVNAWLRDVGGPRGIKDPECRGAAYLKGKATTLDLWYGVYLANLLASTGVFVKEIVDADPPTLDDPGLPEVPLASSFSQAERDRLRAGLGKDPAAPFGSNATAVGKDVTTTGRGMVLGNPHFPWRGRYKFAQQQLTIPGEYDVAGASLVGSPVVNIGWNSQVAWSHTVSTAYRFTPYEYRLLDGATTYATTGVPQQLERREVEVTVRTADGTLETVTEDLYRTPEGYVLDAPAILLGWTPASVWAIRDANAEHLRTIDTFHGMAKAGSASELLAAQDAGGGMPWVNTTVADRAGNVVYADHSVVPHVTDDMAEQCMTPVGRVLNELAGLPGLDGTRAGADCAWGADEDAQRPGILGPENLPDTLRTDWVMNANDSFWLPNPDERLEGFPGIIGCEECERSLRSRVVYRYVIDRLDGSDGFTGRKVSPRRLRGFQHGNRVFGAELMRENGDLDTVCAATGETEACAALAAWDGKSNVESRGTYLFEQFFRRLPTDGSIWEVPFDPADPVGTPRDLAETNQDVVDAMAAAIAAVREQGVAFDARWGTVQVAGDRDAPPIPIGGGEAAAGNANAIASRNPVQNADRPKAVTYGSSHIQSIAFLDRGRVLARTILTYGQSEDPRSPWATDQTRMFGQRRWVAFPFTQREIRRDAIRRIVVGAPR